MVLGADDGTRMGHIFTGVIIWKEKYKVYGLVRKSATGNLKNIKHLIDDPKILKKNFIEKGDLNDPASIQNIILKVKPDEIYNFADQDHVGWSFAVPVYSFSTTTAQSVINILGKQSRAQIKI